VSDAPRDATAEAELIRSGEASPEDLLEAAIERTEALNPELNAVIHPLYDEARAEVAAGLPDGPFKGVPLLFKDIGPMIAGAPFHMGNVALKEAGFKGPVDSFIVNRLRAAGFVIFGKTNVPEFGILPTTESKAWGAAHNPWDTSRTPGGSSGGSAAAVASGMVSIAHANDGGGSIRVPASHCGLVGLKPTRARVSQGPAIGDVMSGLTHDLVLTHTVRDTAAVLDILAGFEPGDPYDAPPPARPYAEEVGTDPGNLRIGLLTDPPTAEDVDPIVVEGAEKTAKLLESLGHEIVPVDFNFVRDLNLVDTFIVRWAAGQAQLASLVSALTGREAGPRDFEPLTWALIEKGRSDSAGAYLEAVATHNVLSRMLAGATLENRLDAVLSPATGEPAPPLGTYDDSGPDPLAPLLRAAKTVTYLAGLNATGQPGISLPLHQTPEGLPFGVQLMADFGREDVLIRLAAQLESAAPWAERRAALTAA
jgi:amidase